VERATNRPTLTVTNDAVMVRQMVDYLRDQLEIENPQGGRGLGSGTRSRKHHPNSAQNDFEIQPNTPVLNVGHIE
jgi:hypothetical protein